jgi:hypothetical protein
MDILAHTLWANYGSRKANRMIDKRNEKKPEVKPIPKLNVVWTSFFGVFPDFFAFTIPTIIMFLGLMTGSTTLTELGSRQGPTVGTFSLASNLYQYSHSLVLWAVVFIVVWFIYKRPRFELLGWALHILIDIPSHVISFFPTPFLFPISNYHFPYGVSWGNKYYMIVNYSLLLICTIYMMVSQKKLDKK